MATRQHSHPKYIQLFKNMFAILAFVYPAYLIFMSTSNYVFIRIVEVFLALFLLIVMLVTAYYFQDIWVDEEGLLIEFLWRKIRVRWVEIIETKVAWGFGPEKNRPLIILVKSLTPFHRLFGGLYGFSTKPAFVIYPSISDFETLVSKIKKNIPKNKRR